MIWNTKFPLLSKLFWHFSSSLVSLIWKVWWGLEVHSWKATAISCFTCILLHNYFPVFGCSVMKKNSIYVQSWMFDLNSDIGGDWTDWMWWLHDESSSFTRRTRCCVKMKRFLLTLLDSERPVNGSLSVSPSFHVRIHETWNIQVHRVYFMVRNGKMNPVSVLECNFTTRLESTRTERSDIIPTHSLVSSVEWW